MLENHNVPFRNSFASKACYAVRFANAAEAAAKRQIFCVVDFRRINILSGTLPFDGIIA
jgi:hypothetical protein